MGLALGEEILGDFSFYYGELVRWNTRKKLTSLRTPQEVAVKHFLDSLALSWFLSPSEELLDIGTGAGFPGLCLKLYQKALRVVLLEASFKRVAFLRHMIRKLGLEGVKVIHGRAEDLSVVRAWEGKFDVVTSRALGPLGEFLPLADPYLKAKGRAIAMKGPNWSEELEGAKGSSSLVLREVREFELPFGMGKRALLVFAKP